MGLWIPDREPMMAILMVLMMGFVTYKLLTDPLITIKFLWKLLVIIALGIVMWFAIILLLI